MITPAGPAQATFGAELETLPMKAFALATITVIEGAGPMAMQANG